MLHLQLLILCGFKRGRYRVETKFYRCRRPPSNQRRFGPICQALPHPHGRF